MSTKHIESRAGDPSNGYTDESGTVAAGAGEMAALKPLPGESLAAERQRLGLSIDDVAMRLRLAPRQIVALEANEFTALLGMATVRGFVRSYAKLLGMQPDPLVAMLSHEPNTSFAAVSARPLSASSFRSRRYASPILHRAGARRLAGLAVVALVFIGTLILVAYRSDWMQLSAADPGAEPTVVAPGSDAVGNNGAALIPLTSGVTPELNPNVAQPAVSQTESPVQAQPRVQQPAAIVQATDTLELIARDDVWVEVSTANRDAKLLSKLMKAGSTELVAMNEPVVLVVGNVAGVQVSLRGQVVDLAAAAHENVARLTLK